MRLSNAASFFCWMARSLVALTTDSAGVPVTYMLDVRTGTTRTARVSAQVTRGRFTLRAQTPKPYVARSRELVTRRGDVVLARFFSGGLWVLEVWTREEGRWMVLTSQVTTAKPEGTGTRP